MPLLLRLRRLRKHVVIKLNKFIQATLFTKGAG